MDKNQAKKPNLKKICPICGEEHGEVFCPKCKTFQIPLEDWNKEIEPNAESVPYFGPAEPPEYLERSETDGAEAVHDTAAVNDTAVNNGQSSTDPPVPLHVLRSVAKYRYWPAYASIVASFFMLLLALVPVGNKSAIANVSFEIVLYSLFGVLSAVGYYGCGVYRMIQAVKDPYERKPLCTLLQVLLLILNVVMFSLILSYGHIPHDSIAQTITVSVAVLTGVVVIVYSLLALYKVMQANTFRRRAVSEKFRRELYAMPQELPRGNKIFMSVVAILMITVIAVAASVSATVGTGPLNEDMISALDMGATQKEARTVLGEPQLIEGNVWHYYSDSYSAVLREIEKAEKRGANTDGFKKQLSEIEYTEARLFFADDFGYYRGVLLGPMKNGEPVKERNLIFATAYSSVSVSGELEYYASLTDGSFEYGLLYDYEAVAVPQGENLPSDALKYADVTWKGYLRDYHTRIPERILPEAKRPPRDTVALSLVP